jgi:CheY-like chemotaxis protein
MNTALQQIKSIVLIDDDHDDAELFREAMSAVAPAVTVTHFNNGRDGLKALSTGDKLPDLVFLDINLPSFSGWHCLSEIRRQPALQQLPVIMYSTSSLPREKEIARDLGAAGFLTKPDDFNTLKRSLARILSVPPGQVQDVFQ